MTSWSPKKLIPDDGEGLFDRQPRQIAEPRPGVRLLSCPVAYQGSLGREMFDVDHHDGHGEQRNRNFNWPGRSKYQILALNGRSFDDDVYQMTGP